MRFTEFIPENANPKRQAAIAIAMKKAGKKPKGVAEGAPELLKAEMPMVRHIENELATKGYKKGTEEYKKMFGHALAYYRKFGFPDYRKGVAEGSEQINELRDRMYQYIRSIVPTWPEYVVQDWLYKGRGKNKNYNVNSDVKGEILEMIADAELSPNTNPWQLVPNMKFTMDMFGPVSKKNLIGRAGGTSDLGMGIPKDKERHSTQAALIQKGGVSKEPAILIKRPEGYDLLEGWHRTIQHFHMYPNGYTGPAYVAVAQGQQGVAEGLNEFAQGDFNSGDDGNDLQLYLNVAKKLNMKKYKPSTAHALIAKKMAELVDVVDDDKVDYARHMARKAQGLPNMLEQGVAEGSLEELANTSLKVKEPKNFVNTNDRKQVVYKVMKFKSGKDTYLINFTVKGAPAFGKKSNWNAVNVAFGVREDQDEYSFGDEINTDLTAQNKNQFLIYSTVINAIRKFITEYNTEIDEIIMQGAGERQVVMYQRFFQSAGKYFPGWHHDGKHSLVRDVPRSTGKKVKEQGVAEGENWSKHNNKRVGGMSKKSVSSYRRSHPGSKIQTAVTTKPSKLKKGSKAAARRKSFCARMRGMKKHRTGAKTAHDPNSNINKSLRRWHCESVEELHELVMLAEQFVRNNKK